MENAMKYLYYLSQLKGYVRFILLLAIVLLNLAPLGTFAVYAAPGNDAWQDAIAISIPFSATVDTTQANAELDEPVVGPQNTCQGKLLRAGLTSIWYTYTPSVNEQVSLDTLGSTTGTQYPYDTYIAVWTGTIDNNPTLIACNDDTTAGYQSELSFIGLAGTPYYVQVAQYNGTFDRPYVAPPYQGGQLHFNAKHVMPASWVGGVSVSSDKNVVAVGRPHIGSEIASYSSFASGSLTAYVPMLFKAGFGSYNAALYVQNVHASNTANITIKYYDSNGVLNCTKADTITPLSSKGYWVPDATCDSGSLPVGWVGGVVVTSNQPIVAVGRPHIGSEVMTYDGFASGSLTTYIPMLFKAGFGSYDAAFYVQNVHASNTASVTLKYYDSNGVLNCTKADTIAPLASKGYWVPIATCDSGSLPAGWVGGVVVTSSQPIVAVGRPHIGTQITTYNGFAAGGLASYIPMLFKGAFGSYDSAFYVQNVHASNTASVTIKYYNNSGVLNCTKADTIAPLASKGYWVPSATCDSGSLPAGWAGGVVVTSNQPIVAVGRPHIGTQVATYNGATGGLLNAYVPMLFKAAFGGSYNAAFYVQNTEGSTANVTIKFYDTNGVLTCVRTDTIPALSILGYWIPDVTCNS
jgi:hypothetical protein